MERAAAAVPVAPAGAEAVPAAGPRRPGSAEATSGFNRRAFLAGTSALALTAGPGASALAADPAADPRGEPFDDGTYFDDGYGWLG